MLCRLLRIDPGTPIVAPDVLYSESLVPPPLIYPFRFLLGGLTGGSRVLWFRLMLLDMSLSVSLLPNREGGLIPGVFLPEGARSKYFLLPIDDGPLL